MVAEVFCGGSMVALPVVVRWLCSDKEAVDGSALAETFCGGWGVSVSSSLLTQGLSGRSAAARCWQTRSAVDLWYLRGRSDVTPWRHSGSMPPVPRPSQPQPPLARPGRPRGAPPDGW